MGNKSKNKLTVVQKEEQPPPKQGTAIEDLSADELREIFEFLPEKDLESAVRVCRR